MLSGFFNQDAWKNFMDRTKKIAANKTMPPPTPPPASPPPANNGGATNGNSRIDPETAYRDAKIAAVTPPQEATLTPGGVAKSNSLIDPGTRNISMGDPGPVMDTLVAQPPKNITMAPVGPVQGDPAAPKPTTYSGMEQDVLDQLAQGMSGKGSDGLNAALRSGREAVAQAGRQMEAQAGARAAKADAFGQGTQVSLADDTQQQVLSALAEGENKGVQAKTAERQDFINKAMDMVGKKQQLDQNDMNRLERMSADNPVLAAKLTEHLMGGKSGKLGDFTPEELEQIKTWQAKQETRDSKLDDLIDTYITKTQKEVNTPTPEETSGTNIDAAISGKTLSSMSSTDWAAAMASPDQLRKIEQSGQYVAADFPQRGTDSMNNVDEIEAFMTSKGIPQTGTWNSGHTQFTYTAGQEPLIRSNGKYYKLTAYKRGAPGNVAVWAIDPTTGSPVQVYNT